MNWTKKMSPLFYNVTALFFKALILNIFVCKKPLLNKVINPNDKYSTFSSSALRWQMLGWKYGCQKKLQKKNTEVFQTHCKSPRKQGTSLSGWKVVSLFFSWQWEKSSRGRANIHQPCILQLAQLQDTEPSGFVSWCGSCSLLPYRGEKPTAIKLSYEKLATWLHSLLNMITITGENPAIRMVYLYPVMKRRSPFLLCLTTRKSPL